MTDAQQRYINSLMTEQEISRIGDKIYQHLQRVTDYRDWRAIWQAYPQHKQVLEALRLRWVALFGIYQ